MTQRLKALPLQRIIIAGALGAGLVLAGASASAQDTEEETPLHHASRGGHAAVVAQLLQASGSERAALLQQRSSSGESAFDMADSDAVRVLLSSE